MPANELCNPDRTSLGVFVALRKYSYCFKAERHLRKRKSSAVQPLICLCCCFCGPVGADASQCVPPSVVNINKLHKTGQGEGKAYQARMSVPQRS